MTLRPLISAPMTTRPRFRVAIPLIVFAVLGLSLAGCRPNASAPNAADSNAPGSNATDTSQSVADARLADGKTIDIVVVIQAPNSKHEFTLSGVKSGETVEALMRSIDEVPVEITGSGVTAFVNEIDGVSTSGSEGWTYKIDGAHAEQGIGSTTLTTSGTITWTFGSYEKQ